MSWADKPTDEWTVGDEDEALAAYHLKPIPGLPDAYRFEKEVAPGVVGVGVYSRREALEKIKENRRVAWGL